MSYASEHPVTCVRREDLGCPSSFPGSKFGAIKAQDEGWFFAKDSGPRGSSAAYCPEHVPEWVTAWRERKRQHGD